MGTKIFNYILLSGVVIKAVEYTHIYLSINLKELAESEVQVEVWLSGTDLIV